MKEKSDGRVRLELPAQNRINPSWWEVQAEAVNNASPCPFQVPWLFP
jgi:hypothetical protein